MFGCMVEASLLATSSHLAVPSPDVVKTPVALTPVTSVTTNVVCAVAAIYHPDYTRGVGEVRSFTHAINTAGSGRRCFVTRGSQ